MSPIVMDFPPEVTAAIGHNSQAYEVCPAHADEAGAAKAAYLAMTLQGDIGERLRILHYAAISMDHAEFHAMWFLLMHGKGDATDVALGQKKLALLMNCSERQVRRIVTELDDEGWFAPRKKQRDARCGKIPARVMQPIIAELVGHSLSAGQDIVVPIAVVPQDIDRTKMSSRTPMSGSASKPSRTPMSGSESRVGHFCPNEPDMGVRLTIKDEPLSSLRESNIYTPRARTREDPPAWQMAAALNPAEKRAQQRIWRTVEGSLEIADELRAELAKDFPLVPIDETLRIVKTESRISDTALHLLSVIERKFSYAQRDELGRDRRAAARQPVNARQPHGNPLLHFDADVPDAVRQRTLRKRISEGKITEAEALTAGYRHV